jgi:hypothetical protein
MNLRINHHYIYITFFAFFFFFWGVSLHNIDILKSLNSNFQYYEYLHDFKLNYFIIFLIIPILYSFIKKGDFSFKQIFNYQKNIIFFVSFVIVHFFLVSIYYDEIINKSEIAKLIFFLLLSIIYCHHREFLLVNFKKIIFFYLIILISFSIYEGSELYNLGQCNSPYFIDLIQSYLNISFSNSIYLENSHLAMGSVAVFFSCLYIALQEKKINILFLLLLSIEIIILLNNVSTTYFVGYFFSIVTLLIFFIKKINIKFWIVAILLLSMNFYIFTSDKSCSKKVTDLRVKDVLSESLIKDVDVENKPESFGEITNLTSYIYRRSAIVVLNTFKSHPLGWGFYGMDNATLDLMRNYTIENQDIATHSKCKFDKNKNCIYVKGKQIPVTIVKEEITAQHLILLMNLDDGLSNFLKMFTEFGIFTFVILFYFIKYILNLKNISPYNLFIIVLFVMLCIRGAGYFSGGFIFCLLEFFYYKKFTHKLS